MRHPEQVRDAPYVPAKACPCERPTSAVFYLPIQTRQGVVLSGEQGEL